MEAVKKYWLLGIFISILSIFAMSHNAKALDFVLDLDNYTFQQTVRQGFECAFDTALTFNTVANYCDLNGTNNNISAIRIPAKTYTSGDIISFDIVVNYNGYTFTNGETPSGYFTQPFVPPQIASSNDYYVLDIQQLYFDDSEHLINYYNEYFCRAQGTGTDCQGYPELTQSGSYYQAFRVYLKVKRDLRNTQLTILGSSYALLTLNGYNIGQNYVRAFVYRYNIYSRAESKDNKEVEEKTQGAVDDSQAAGGSSSQDAQTGTTGLLNAITGAVNVISAARPTNCKINGNMGNLDMGQLDLCANPAPAFVQTIGSLILILMCVPLAISLFNRFITIFRSFQS